MSTFRDLIRASECLSSISNLKASTMKYAGFHSKGSGSQGLVFQAHLGVLVVAEAARTYTASAYDKIRVDFNFSRAVMLLEKCETRS